jgi:hypothetical protein
MQIESISGWIALIAAVAFIIAPIVYFGIKRKSRE